MKVVYKPVQREIVSDESVYKPVQREIVSYKVVYKPVQREIVSDESGLETCVEENCFR